MSDHVTVIVLAVADGIGTEPDMAHVAIRGTNTSTVVPAARIAADAGLVVNELPGREFMAGLTVGERDDELTGFRLVNDPRE
jgi:hypothetical protein